VPGRSKPLTVSKWANVRIPDAGTQQFVEAPGQKLRLPAIVLIEIFAQQCDEASFGNGNNRFPVQRMLFLMKNRYRFSICRNCLM